MENGELENGELENGELENGELASAFGTKNSAFNIEKSS